MRRLSMPSAAMLSTLLLGLLTAAPAWAGHLELGFVPNPEPGQQPALLITPDRALSRIEVAVEAGGESWSWEQADLPAGEQLRFPWTRDTSVTTASAHIIAVFDDGYVEELTVPVSYSYAAPLSVSLERASADLAARTLTVSVTTAVQRADITAYGAHKAVLDERTVELAGGPGDIEIPWVGEAEEVVLLDVKVHADNAWAGFTYSPWFLDIPHEDVLFESDQAVIRDSEAPKLQATLVQLHDVLDKYGDVVPVKLYIAGCTDTVGDVAHNRDLSKRRAKAIAAWLRNNGYDRPIYFHGFGEGLLAVPTGDGVDEARNRRALYMVGANPPPAGSGVPSVGWTEL